MHAAAIHLSRPARRVGYAVLAAALVVPHRPRLRAGDGRLVAGRRVRARPRPPALPRRRPWPRAGPAPSARRARSTTSSTASGARSRSARSPSRRASRPPGSSARSPGRPTSPSTVPSATACAPAMASSAAELTPRAREIAAAARALLDEEGPDALTMRRVADRLGIQAPSIYKHLAGKEALEAAVISQGFVELAEVFEDAVAGQRRPAGGARGRLPRVRARPAASLPADDGAPASPRPARPGRRGARGPAARRRPPAATRRSPGRPGRSRTG